MKTPVHFILTFIIVIFLTPLAQGQTEPPDFPNTGTGPNFNLESGANEFSGTITTPSDGQDRFQITLFAGQTITSITCTITENNSPNGFFTINAVSVNFPGGTFPTVPSGAGTYQVLVAAGFSVGENWSITVNVSCNGFGPIIYVDKNASGANTGTNWANAFTNLETALALHICTTITEIRVAGNQTHKPSTSRECINCTGITQENYFLFNGDIIIKGSYIPDADGDATNDIQDYSQVTILSGDIAGDDIITGSGATLNIANNSDNNYHVVIVTLAAISTAMLDGFTITGGNASGTGNMIFTDFSIPDNSGGGLANVFGELNLSNLIFIGNNAVNGGGLLNAANSTLTNITFASNNATTRGGAIANLIGNPTLTNITFIGNNALSEGGGIYNNGNPTLTNSTFIGNNSFFGGGLLNLGDPTIYNNVFYGNITSIGTDVDNTSGNSINSSSSNNFSDEDLTSLNAGFTTLSVDPFTNSANPNGADGIYATPDDGLVPAFGSTIVDAGDNIQNSLPTDIAGQTRIFNTTIDVGAYENQCIAATFDTLLSTLCQTEGTQTGLGGGLPTGGVYSGAGVTNDGNGTTYSFNPSTSGTGNITVTYTVNDVCSGGVVNLEDIIIVTDGIPTLICQNTTVTLDGSGNATIVNADVVANLLPGSGYTVGQSGTFAPIDISTGATNLSLGDDGSAAVTMFSFPFFGNNFTTVYVSSNGYLSFTNAGLGEFANDVLPDANAPQNVIAAVWDDLNPSDGGIIRYKSTGASPNRIFVVEYLAVPHFVSEGGSTNTITTQVQLYEGSGRIEIHTTNADSDAGTRTQGIENTAGDTAFVTPGRNATDWTATNDFVAFVPNPGGLADNCGFAVSLSLSQTAFTCEDIGDVIVTVTADDGNGGIATCDATVTVVGTTSTFTGGSWDVTPNAESKALFQDSYSTTANGNVTACSCEIETGNTVTVNAGGFMDITGNILVDGILDVQHEGSVVQTNDLATVTNNGSITVRKATPTLEPTGFMILGNPMTAETRTGVYGSAARVLNHITGNFVPNGAVGGGTENFADDNNNNWALYTGVLTPAEGYLVKPFLSGSPAGVLDLDYTLGTLNNGVVTYNLLYNGTRESSANMLGNPYASAIDNDLFLAGNPLIDAIYYWQHITAPSGAFPGFNQLNYNLGDISVYNQGSGGVAASNGGGIPTQFMSSGQGFGVKALGAGTVTFNNSMRVIGPNTDYRSSENNDRQRIWLDLTNEAYGLYSNMLVAFTQGATDGFENKYDSKRFDTPISLYSELETGETLAIQGRTAFHLYQEIPLGFNTQIDQVQTYTISINQLEGEDLENTDVYVEDRLLHISTNLSEVDYTFTANKGEQTNRFVLVFRERVLDENDMAIKNISIHPNPSTGLFTISSVIAQIDKVEVRDTRGRLMPAIIDTANDNYIIDLQNLETAMYFVKLYTSEGTFTKRVIKE